LNWKDMTLFPHRCANFASQVFLSTLSSSHAKGAIIKQPSEKIDLLNTRFEVIFLVVLNGFYPYMDSNYFEWSETVGRFRVDFRIEKFAILEQKSLLFSSYFYRNGLAFPKNATMQQESNYDFDLFFYIKTVSLDSRHPKII